MLGSHFYNESTRKIIVAFGTLFNNITLKTTEPATGKVIQVQKVPLAYGPKQKFIARLEQYSNKQRKTSITLPRIYFEMTGISYDSSRKLSPIQKYTEVITGDGTKIKTQYVPVPYNLGFELGIIAKSQNDALQIVEQILPFFQPSFNVTINMITDMDEKRDVPFVLDNITYEDTWDESFLDRRYITYVMFFTAKTYFYGPSTQSALIREAITKEYPTTDIVTPGRYRQYSVTPKAKEDNNEDGVIDTLDDALVEPGDDFGFNELVTFAEDL